MAKIKDSLLSKLLSILLVVSILLGLIPISSTGAVPVDDSKGTIETLVNGGSIDAATGVVNFSTGCELEWSAANPAVGRNSDGWWVGIKVTAPANLNLEKASYQNKTSNGWGVAKSFKTYRDSNDASATQYITLWGIVNEGYINDAILNGKEYLEYGYQFDWDGDGTYEQPISMRIDPNKIVLNKESSQVYPKATGLAEIDVITNGITTTNNGGNIVVVENTSNVELTWAAKDESIGRTQDGWWIGYHVVAPANADIEKATYQYKTSTGWDTANTQSFNTNKDTVDSIQVWRLVNETYLNSAVANNKEVNYITRYDWDGDGVYEQIVHLKINPNKVTLIKDGEKVYPYLGIVTPLTGGTVSGNTSNLELKIEEANLNWSPKDDSIGRHTDGWWVGMKVTAPEGYTASQLQNATYKRRVTSSGGTAWTDYSSNINFWTAKDSKDSDSSHYIGMWMVVNPSLITTYKNNGTNIKTEYVFDWDGDGIDDQTITFTVVPSDKIVLNKVEQTGFAFVEPNPVDKWVGEAYTNTASGGQGTGNVTYAITSGSDVADIDAATGKLTFKKIGTVEVTATKAADDTYAQVTATYTVTSAKSAQAVFKFEISAPGSVEFAQGEYQNSAVGGSGTGKVTYSISDEKIATIDENTGKVTFIKAGEVTIVATKAADDHYTETTATYTLKIEKSNQDVLYFETSVPSTIIYSPEAQNILSALKGGSGSGEVTYFIESGSEYAEIDAKTGAIKTLKAGGTFTVKVVKAGDDGYYETSYTSAAIYVEYAEQTDFVFADQAPASVTFNDNNNIFSNVASGGESNGAITYAFADVESDNIADLNATTGEITINAAGTINVTATKAGDDCYKETTAQYALTVKKDTPEFTVEDVNLIYGVTEYQINVNTTLGGSGSYVYAIEGTNNIGASVDNSGKITFENSTDKVGSITVTVQKEADNQYVESEVKNFVLTVSYHEPTAQPTLSGATKNASGWYTDVVTVFAPEGYEISYSNDLTGTIWKNSVEITDNGINNKSVYLKKDDEISGAIEISDVLIDTVAPVNVEIKYENTFIEKVLQAITFGIYEADTVTVTFVAEDLTSGIDYFTYNIGDGDVVVDKANFKSSNNFIAEYEITLPAQYRNKIKMSATDIAGWTSELTETKHLLVVDSISPKIDIKYEFVGSKNLGDIIYTNKDVTVKFEIEEANFDLSLEAAEDETVAPAPVLTINGVAQDVSWTQIDGTDKWGTEITLTGNGDYVVELSYTDRSTNAMETYTKEIHIDGDAPVFNVTYDNNEARNENNYKADREATIKVTEHNFKAEEVELTVSAKDITSADVDLSSKAYAAYAKNAANWTQDGDVWTLVLPKFDIEAIYNVKLAYTDLAENEATPYTADFVIDKTIANSDNVTIEYSESIVDKILEAVTFGFYKGDVEVKVTVKDQTAGIEYFEITYTQVDGNNNSNKATYTTEKITAIQNKDDKTVFTATHTITAEARGKVSVSLSDKAGNTTNKAEEYVIVADTIVPGLDYEWKFTDEQVREYNNIYYTKGETKVEFTIEEANFDLSLEATDDETVAPAPVLTVNGVAQDITWTQIDGTDKWVTDITLTGNGDYVVELSYTDRSTNAMETYTKEIHIDGDAPVFNVTYDNNEARNENNYKADREATIKVTEHNFKAEEVELTVTAKDITDAEVEGYTYFEGTDGEKYVKEFYDYSKDVLNWTQDGDVWTLVLPKFDIEAIYNVKLAYTDLAENEATPYTADFVIDKTIANSDNVTIEYSESIVDKVLETITFGFYQADVTVTVTVEDTTAGIESFEIIYTQVDGKNNSNKATYTTEKLTAVQDKDDKTVFTATHTITAEARGKVSVNIIDKAGNTTGRAEEYVVVADTIIPGLDYEWKFTDEQVREYNNIFHTKGETKVEFTIEEANFDLSLKTADDETVAPAPVLTVNGVTQDITWTQIDGTDKWVTDITLTGNGDYVVELSYTDRSTNAMETYTKEIHIDNEAPVFDVSYDNNEARNENNYKADREATIKVTEHNFKAEEVELTVTAKDITGAEVEGYTYFEGTDGEKYVKEFYDYAKDTLNWTQENDVWTLNTEGMKFKIDAIYSVKIQYTDLAENEAIPYTADFVIDENAPSNIKIAYSESIVSKIIETITFGFYQSEVTVTITADDIISGVDFFEWTYTKEDGTSDKNADDFGEKITAESIEYSNNGMNAKATFKIPANARGYITAFATDRAENSDNKIDDKRINVVDDITPTISVKYEAVDNTNTKVQFVDDQNATVDSFDKATNAYYNGNVTAKIVINEANFFEGVEAVDVETQMTEIIYNVGIKLTKTDDNGNVTVYEYLPEGAVQKYDDATPVYITWTTNNDEHSFNINYADNADYVLEIDYTDLSTNDAGISANDGNTATKTYKSKVVTVDKSAPVVDIIYDNNEAKNDNNYKADREATIKVIEHNFRADKVVLTVLAKNITDADVDISSKAYAEYAKNAANWTQDGNVWTLVLPKFDIEAIYSVKLEYTDLAKNEATPYTADFVIDKTAPSNIKIEYSESIISKIIETITFGFYQSDVTVTLTAEDITSGVDYFEWTYTKEEGTSDKNAENFGTKITTENIVYSNNGMTATATFKIPANARGYITSSVTDKAGNSDNVIDDKIINVVDDIAPTISVKYEADNTNTKVQFVDNQNATVDSFDKATNAYYNGNVTAKIVINEANFFEGVEVIDVETQMTEIIHNVGIKLTKTDDNRNEMVYEYLPEGAVQKYDDATPVYITWTTNNDEHSFNINYADNADYVLEIEYTDLSTNDANISANDGNTTTKTYKSKIVTVDKIAPVVTVVYSNENIIHTIDGREYYNDVRIATITVQEHNFRADDFVPTVIAKDILGNDVSVEDFSDWTNEGNTHTITMKYSVDANYTFDYEYKDLAENAATDYATDLFTVDTTSPENLTISYSQSIADKILDTITFGYYNAKVIVTITAEDDTAGIHRFEYAYLKSEGVSSVNAELLKAAIEEADFTIDGKKVTATFEIPKDVLKSDNQFNGTVNFVAFDRSENNDEMKDTRQVIVDNIAPTATITYNKPVQIANNISYYDGNIDAKIVINEANFYSEDVVVSVTKNGVNYPVNVKWANNSVDVHTGTFTFTEDGDYIVNVKYVDRSSNEMDEYTSNRLTLDTKAPTVNVTNIKNNSANKDETYGFTITVNDINFDATSFKPVLTATIRKEDGSYGTKTISLGEMKTVEEGKTYTFTVDNLEEDAVYSLVCNVKDMSANEYSKIVLDDGKEYEEVRFSINRNGSTFAVDKNTDALVNQYYVYSVNDDVVIEEVNVDPVETYVVKLNGEVLTEGTDYTTTLSDKAEEWSKRTYVISKDLFVDEGEYSIVVESIDKTNTTAYSDVKNLNVSFVVDQTAPVLTISGLENGGRYQVEEQTVTVIPTDDGGRLYSIKVVVLDSDGKPLKDENGKDISVRFEMSGEEFLNYLSENEGKVTFTVPEGLENQVQIICNDYATNAEGKTNEYNETFTKVTISQSGWIIYYANKPLFYGSIAGVLLLIGGIILLIVLKKRKKQK